MCAAYPGKYTPACYLLSDDPLINLIWEINASCSEAGALVEKYANETREEKYLNDRGKEATRQVPKWSIEEILSPDFNPDMDDPIRRPSRPSWFGEQEAEGVDVDSME